MDDILELILTLLLLPFRSKKDELLAKIRLNHFFCGMSKLDN